MINYILGGLIAAAIVFCIVKLIKRSKEGGCCAGCTACQQGGGFQNGSGCNRPNDASSHSE